MHLSFPVDLRGIIVHVSCEYLEIGNATPVAHTVNKVLVNGQPVTLTAFEQGVILRAAFDEAGLERNIENELEGI